MYRFFIQSVNVRDSDLSIFGEDVNHIKNVLRMKPGEVIDCVDEDRTAYRCSILTLSDDEIVCGILERHRADTELPNRITLYMGIPKSGKPELVIQKTVELGVAKIVPMVTRRTIVRLDKKRAENRRSRWQAVAEAAAKQSKRAYIPEVGEVVPFADALREAAGDNHLFIPYEQETDIARTRSLFRSIGAGESVSVFVGPEGGFEESEIKEAERAGARPITLGRRILRAETACVAVLAMLMYELDDGAEE